MNVSQPLLDKFAVGLSAACVVHCLLLPVLLVIIPSVPLAFIADEQVHLLLLFLVVPVSALALGLGCRKHGNWSIALCGAIGLGVLVFAAFWGHDFLGHDGERIATVLGSLIIATGHILNHRLCKKRQCCE